MNSSRYNLCIAVSRSLIGYVINSTVTYRVIYYDGVYIYAYLPSGGVVGGLLWSVAESVPRG